MFLEINEIGEDPVSINQRLTLPRLDDPGPDFLEVDDVSMRGVACRDDDRVEFSGRLEARLRLACSRCLEAYETALSADFSLVLVGEAVEFGTGETEVRPEDAELFYTHDGRADLRTIAAEQIYLNLPLKPLCDDACRGLCPTCGANRNRIECDCSEDVPDPRLAPLSELKRRMKPS